MSKLLYGIDIIPTNFTGLIEYRTGTIAKVNNGIIIDIMSEYYLASWCHQMNKKLSPTVY